MAENGYKVGSLAWVVKNEANAYRDILEAILSGAMTREDAKAALDAVDSDSASF